MILTLILKQIETSELMSESSVI